MERRIWGYAGIGERSAWTSAIMIAILLTLVGITTLVTVIAQLLTL